MPDILVLGVGNLLLGDEGLGVHAIRSLLAAFELSPEVRVMDAGTAGVALLDAILGCYHLIVADAATMGAAPGTVVRLEGAALPDWFVEKQSAHDWGLAEVLLQARLLGHRPEVVVIAVEPATTSAWQMDLSPVVAAGLAEVVARLVDEIRAAGGRTVARA